MPKISVKVSEEVHAAVRVRAFREGRTLDELGRGFFEWYAENGLSAGDATVEVGDSRLGAGERSPGSESTLPAGHAPGGAAPAERSFRPDPKVKK